jgi:hypothetical protein
MTKKEIETTKAAKNDKGADEEARIKTQLITLSIGQMNAIDLLITGASDREVAEKIGISRQTVTNWRLYHPAFQAELGRRREEVWGLSADKMRTLLPRALAILEETFDNPQNPDRLKLAVEIVKQSGIFTTFKTSQVTDAIKIIEQQTPNKSMETLDPPDEADRIEAMKQIQRKIEG